MSATRDPDRILRAWLEQMPDEAPDRAITAVLQATEAAPQARVWPGIGPWRPQMNRLSLIAATAVVGLALVGGAMLLTSGHSGPTQPTPSAAASPTALANAPAPEALQGTWLADLGAPAATANAAAPSRLVIQAGGLSVYTDGAETFVGRSVAGASGEFAFAASTASNGCQAGDVGRYRYALGTDGTTPNSDGTILRLTVVADTCAARQAILDRRWVHAIDGAGSGGRGASIAFTPMFMITLPKASYRASMGSGALEVALQTPERTMYAVHNPQGWTDPCSASGGTKRTLAPTIAAFTAYLRTLPGFTVQSTDLKIDNDPAVRLVVPSAKTADCASNRVNEWTTSDPANSGGWNLHQGETDVLYLVEVKGGLVLLQWLGPDVTAEEEQALFSTIHFIDALPA
jgi:hypothetical protein